MTNPVALSDKISSVLLHGDLRSLTEMEKTQYAKYVCDRMGLDISTKPFDFINLSGKLVMYATKSCTDQLRKIHGVSIVKIEKEMLGDIFTVTAHAVDRNGKEDSDMGAVDVKGLSGEKLANAMLKAITKAKRRVTLSICGLGMLDETEIEDVPREAKSPSINNDPFGKKAALEKAPELPPSEIPEDEFEAEKPEDHDLGNYEIKFGKKHMGKRLKDLDSFELDNYLTWMKNAAAQKGQELTGNALELAEIGEAYLKSLEFELKR